MSELLPSNRIDFTILDETDEWIVVDKPAPLLVHPSKPSPTRTLWDELKDLLSFELAVGGQISIITRLDRETSGVVLIAKRADVARDFSVLMQKRCFGKRYLALVWGWPVEDRFQVDAPLLRQGEVMPSAIWLKRMVHADGQEAVTNFRVINRFERTMPPGGRFSLIEARPLTGRMHQIRVHLQYAGYSVVGDKIYGPDPRHYLTFIETGWTESLAAELLLPRQALHAATLTVQRNGADLSWSAPLPAEMDWMSELKSQRD